MAADMKALSDAALPGLAIALDPAALTELLARALPECRRGVTLSSAQAVDVQYEPGQRATVLVKLKLHPSASHRTTRQLLCVRVLRIGEEMPTCPPELLARHAARHDTKDGARESPLETAWLPLPEHGLLVQAFPLDPGLPSLLDVTDPAMLATALTQLWAPRGTRAKRVRVETLAYTPESRAALAYDILCEDRETRLPHQRKLVGKIHVRRSPARLFANAWAVWRSAKGRVNIAPPVGFIESLGLSLQEFVPGVRLSDLAGTGAFLKPIRQAARAIAHVHAQHLPLHSERDLAKEGAVVRRWIGVLEGIVPERRDEISRLGERLLSELGRRFTPRGAVHADFHLANILVHRDAVTIVDWDQAAHGDPMLDVGRLLASLRVSALRTTRDPAGLSDAADAFLTTYLEVSGEDESRARLFEASALLIAAGAPFRLQREGWKEQAELLLDETWACLERATPRTSVATASVEAMPPFDQRLEWAMDHTLANALIAPLVRKARALPGLDIASCKPRLRASSAKAFEVEYALQGTLDGEDFASRVLARGDVEHGGRGMLRRLDALRAALEGLQGAPSLPFPIGHAAPLALSVIEPVMMEHLAFDSIEGAEAAGRSLACLQSARVELDKERSLEKELHSARERAAAASDESATELLAQIEVELAQRPLALAVSLRDLRPQDISWDGTRIGVRSVRDVVLAPLPVMVGLVHGRLLVSGSENAPSIADAFATAWARATGVDDATLRPFLALGLLRAKMTPRVN